MKKIFFLSFLVVYMFAHPVSYTIELDVGYDELKKEFLVKCKSNSRNKCGLHNFHLLDKSEKIIKTVRFPFMKKQTTVKIDTKPSKMIFFLRKVPEHIYSVIVD